MNGSHNIKVPFTGFSKLTRQQTCLLRASLLLGVIGGLGFWGVAGWCWGAWGRQSRIMQTLFQCHCPAGSENARYYPLKLLVPACNDPQVLAVSPSSRFVLIAERQPGYHMVRIDLSAGRQERVQQQPMSRAGFITDDVVLMRQRGGGVHGPSYLVYDFADGTTRQIPTIQGPNFGDDALSAATLQRFRQAEQVVIVSYIETIALSKNYKNDPQESLVIYSPGDERAQEIIERDLRTAQITYTVQPPPYSAGATPFRRYARNGQLWADETGLYTTTGDQQLVQLPYQPYRRTDSYGQIVWGLDDRIVVYEANPVYLFWTSLIRFFYVPQPILFLDVPQEYWGEAGE